MFERVLILTVDAGGGHTRAAQALQEAFRRLDAAREVRIADTMAYTSKLFWRLFLKIYMDMIQKAPELYGWFYDHLDKPVDSHGSRNLFARFNTRPVLKLLNEYRPDLVISTHALPAGIVSWLRAKDRIATPHAIVVTDFDIHAMWLCEHHEFYFVAIEETKLHLEALGVPPEKVVATGIPIDPVFAERQDRTEARRQLGLDPDRTTILVASGSWGIGPVVKIVEALQDLRKAVQVVALCAMNERLKDEVDQIARGRSRPMAR
jgi:processive 1,2-diacylglycerol beta-glucosyltransferase